MNDVFGHLKSLLKTDEICIDNLVFKLHYKLTFLILLCFSALLTCRQYLGNPIDCIVDGSVPINVMETYCWIQSTFNLPNRINGKASRNTAYPGVSNFEEGVDGVKYQNYYLWVCFVLFFQAIFFCIPRYIWKIWEGGRMRALVLDLNSPLSFESEHKQILVNYFVEYLHKQNIYAIQYFFCEIFNLCNVFLQIYFMDRFLEGEFKTYGYDVLRMTELNPEDRVDVMSRVFPKVTKCTFRKYGPSGTIQKIDGLCVLSQNVVNEKIYVFLWFWFWFIAIISALNFVYRILLIMVPYFRLLLLRSRTDCFSYEKLNTLTQKFWFGDWFVFYQLAKNVSPMVFREIVSKLTKKFEGKDNV
ncbi:innexin inx2-like [Metopolophium dirhodum]|uniref:innexin inx2-like n=1 Tax=Metopolophium dirhodum TaxID=44670 RepID=UPI0029903A05|nr:innexin inx2-like [Metopolophium dirhodum]